MKKKITEIQLQELQNKIWLDFLENANQEDLYKSVITSNWDGNEILLNWLKENPKTDKATILVSYWMSAPRWKKKFLDRDDCLKKQGWGIEEFDFVEDIEKKYVNGFYTVNEIEFDPSNDVQNYDWTSDYLDEKTVREIPNKMFEKLNGKKIEYPDNFDEGLPINYAQKIYDIFNEYDIEE